jgi:hypothetical protein
VVALIGWLGVCANVTLNSTDRPFVECPGYPRLPVRWWGSPQVDRVAAMPGPEADPGRVLRHGGIYDSETGSHLIAHFALVPPYTETPGTMPPYELMLMLDLPVLLAVNSTLYGGGVSELADIQRGMRIGTVNCQPLIAGMKLAVSNGQIVTRVSLTRRPTPVEATG